MDYDVIVIGGGPAGVTAALRARELGASVALVEKARMGGTCTNDGCAPTRVLAKAARLMRDASQFSLYGLDGCNPELDWQALIKRTQQVIYQIHEKKQLQSHLAASGVENIIGEGGARFIDPHTIQVSDDKTLRGKSFIIAAGGHPRRIAFPGSEHALVSSDVWQIERLPQSVAVIGAAATGCQLASVFNDFGANVTLIEVMPRILGSEDELVSQVIQHQFEQRGIKVITGSGGAHKIEPNGTRFDLHYRLNDTVQVVTVDAVIMSVGWVGNIDDLNLEAARVETERGFIKANNYLQTSAPHIFSAGDINGRMMLVQGASHEGRYAAEHAVLGTEHFDHSFQDAVVPHGGFTDPEYGGVGVTESQARDKYDVAVATVNYADLDRAVIDGHTVGFCKIIVNREDHRIIGAHVVGEQALEIVQIVAAGMVAGTKIEQLAELAIAYPTFTAIVGLAARQLVRELGAVRLAEEYRTLNILDMSEWERS